MLKPEKFDFETIEPSGITLRYKCFERNFWCLVFWQQISGVMMLA